MAEALAAWLGDRSGRRTQFLGDPEAAVAWAGQPMPEPPRVVLFELSYPGHRRNGLDILLAFAHRCPETALVCYTAATGTDRFLLGLAWSTLQPLSVMAKSAPAETLCRFLTRVTTTGQPIVEPTWRPQLVAARAVWTARGGLDRLVGSPHRVAVWAGLLDCPAPPAVDELAHRCRLSVPALRACCSELEAHLAVLGGPRPTTLGQLWALARQIRPLLDDATRAAPTVADRSSGPR